MSFSNKTVQTYTSYGSVVSSSASFGPVTRKNVVVEAGCGVAPTDTWFLPQKLKFDYRLVSVLTESDILWYQDTPTARQHSRHRLHTIPPARARRSRGTGHTSSILYKTLVRT